MTISEIYQKLPEATHCALQDIFTLSTYSYYIFPLLKRLDIDWVAVEKHLPYSGKYLRINEDVFMICCRENIPFLLVHNDSIFNYHSAHCTDTHVYEDYFMPDVFKYAIRWNKCDCFTDITTDIKLLSEHNKLEFYDSMDY